ncbi:MAG: histidine phosphatase family protein [Bacteroidales bacterium]|jgi:broad specificity phosphatase PhoE|nr:histidine phosphatase family protein [Bacteroidales bacterium]
MTRFYLFFSFIFLSLSSFAQHKIYLIRHANVDIEKPGWSNAKSAQIFKEEYNRSDIQEFDPELVLSKIDNTEKIDAIFCSPQLRAIQTADILFDKQVIRRIDTNLMEFDYSVNRIPLIRLPVNTWLAMSRISWMIGNSISKKPTYRERKDNLEIFVDEIIEHAEKNGKSVVVAHGMLNRELIRILKKKGWTFENKDGFGNLSVNCLIK